jgi:cytochrome oxidase Cu insertion factor (SCO1/SenC/PrrC family)
MKIVRTWSASCLLFASAFGWTIASAHPQRVTGTVLSVLGPQREAVVLQDAVGAKRAVTTRFRLAANVRTDSLHAGDHVVALDGELEEVRVVPEAPPRSVVRTVHPLVVGDEIPATRFVDQLGHGFSFADFRGTSVVLAFVYTRCRDAKECPLISANFRLLQARFANGPYHLVEMTLDPSYDRPAVLARYGKLFGADAKRWTFGTGDPATVLDFDARFGIDPFADPRVGLIHTERTVLIGPNGKIVDFIDQAGWTADDVAARVQAIESPSSNPIARLDFELSKAAVAVCGNRVAGFSGLGDLAIVLVIIGAGGWLLQRLARKIFAEQI